MAFIPTPIPDLIIFEPTVYTDDRGYFFESYQQQLFEAAGINAHFVQDNQSRSTYGVLRGLHYQVTPFAQAKLVRVLEGEVLDIAVDIREDSPTYGQWFGVVLSAANKRQLFVPRGFAHGYVVLSPTAEFFYKCDNFYSKAHEGSIRYDDAILQIDWQVAPEQIILSAKDKVHPGFGNHRRI